MLTLQLLRSSRRRPQSLPLSPAANPSITTAPAATKTTLHPTKHPRQHPLPFFLSNITQQSAIWWHQRHKHCAATPSPSSTMALCDASSRYHHHLRPKIQRRHHPRRWAAATGPLQPSPPLSTQKIQSSAIMVGVMGMDVGGTRRWQEER